MYGSLDVATSGMIAQRTRLEAITANLVNKDSIIDAKGNYSPYLRRRVEFAPGDPTARTAEGRAMGVHVARITKDEGALRPKWDPTSPFADASGNVMVPDISPVVEYTNALEASRAYEANVVAAEAIKAMMAQALRLIA